MNTTYFHQFIFSSHIYLKLQYMNINFNLIKFHFVLSIKYTK